MMQSLFVGENISAQNSDFEEMVEYAIKAPSGHNTQPWKFFLAEKAIDIYPDFNCSLPVVDGTHRELYISLGCATENLCVAARKLGYQEEVSILYNAEGVCYIHVILQRKAGLSSSLFDEITKRQTNRRAYTGREVTTDTIDSLKNISFDNGIHAYFYRKDEDEFKELSAYIYRGNEAQMTDKGFKDELTGWIRLNKKQVEKTKDGLTYEAMGSPSVPTFIGRPIVRSFLKPKAQNKSDRKKVESSSHLVLFTTQNNTPQEWIFLGRSLERFLLETTRLGIANAYMNQPCEVPGLAKELRTTLFADKAYPTLLLRIGYAQPMPYSPRKETKAVIISHPGF